MKKRLVAAMLCTMIAASAVTGCNGGLTKPDAGTGSTQASAQSTAETAAPKEEPAEAAAASIDMTPITEADPSEYIELPDFSTLKISVAEKEEVTEEDIEREYRSYEEDMVVLSEVEDRDISQSGDIVNIDYKEKDGSGEEYTGSDYNVEIGAGTTISAEFEKNLIGIKKGETKTFEFTYPDDFTEEKLRGTVSEFTVTVNKIQRYDDSAEFSDEAVASFGLHMEDGTLVTTKDGLREYIRESLEAAGEQTYLYNKQSEAIVAAASAAVIKKEPTEEMLNAGMAYMMAGIGMEEGNLDEATRKAFREYTKDFVIEQLCIEAIFRKQGLSVTEDDIKKGLESLYGSDAEKQFNSMTETDRFSYTAMLKREKAADYILSKAEIVDVKADNLIDAGSEEAEEVITAQEAESEGTENTGAQEP